MSLTAAAACATLGAVGGAVLPRIAYRLSVPFGTPPRSACAHCGRPFPAGTSGWVRLGAPCRCPASTDPPATRLMLGSALAAGLLGWSGLPGWSGLFSWSGLLGWFGLPGLAVAAVLGVLLAVVDLRCLRLPDVLVAALAAVTILPLTVAALAAGEPGRIGRGLLAAGACFAGYLLLAMMPGGGLGFGDVKLAAVLGFLLGWVGWTAVLIGLVVPQLINGPIALFLLVTGRARRGTALPFGPALLTGALLAVALTTH